MTNPTLSSTRIAALEADRLKLIVVPLGVQPDFPVADCHRFEGLFHFTSAATGFLKLSVSSPYTIGQTIPTPHGNLIVTDVQVKRVQDVTELESRAAGFKHDRYWRASTDFVADFKTQHGLNAWDRNVWCAFVSVRKEGE